jgi:hypothetical protein
MARRDIDAWLTDVAKKFARAREGRTGRSVRAYPHELWKEVGALSRAGVSNGDLCRRCGFSGGTLSAALGRSMAEERVRSKPARGGVKKLPSASEVKSLQVELGPQSSARTCEVHFPNGVIVRLEVGALDESFLGRIRAC